MSSTSDHSKLESKLEKLRFDPTSPVVYERWLKAQYAQAGTNYGIYATIFLTGTRHAPTMPETPDVYDEMAAHNPIAVLFLKKINTYANALELSVTTSKTVQTNVGQHVRRLNQQSRSSPPRRGSRHDLSSNGCTSTAPEDPYLPPRGRSANSCPELGRSVRHLLLYPTRGQRRSDRL